MTTPVRRVPRLLAMAITAALAVSGAVSGTALSASADVVFEVTGTLFAASTPTSDAAPLTGVAVFGAAIDGNGNPAYGDSTVTDENGAFTIAFETAGDYTLQFNCSNVDQSYCNFAYPREYLGHSSDARHATTFALTESAPTLVQDFTLEGVSQIRGTVVDEAGDPASGAYVYANHPGQTGGDSTTADENGEFTLARVAAGTTVVSSSYYPTASAQDRRFYADTYYPGTVELEAATALTIVSGSETTDIDIPLALEPSVRVHVVDEQGDPVSGIALTGFTLNEQTGEFESPRSGESLGTNADGWYARSEAPGTYKYRVADYRYPSVDDFSTPQARVENYDSEWFDNARDEATAAIVTVSETSVDQRVLEVVLAEHTGAPTLLGDLEVGPTEEDPSTLTAVGIFDVTPATAQLTRQWLRDGMTIDGATGPSYSLTAADAGTEITLQLTATLGSPESVAVFTSPPFDVSGLAFDDAPAPTISGDAITGHVLTADPKTWSPTPSLRTYQWLRDGEPVAGATGLTYELGADDIGSTISLRTTGRLAGYTRTTVVSEPTGPVLDVFVVPTVIPAPTGEPTVGHTLTAVTGSWSPQPDSYRYQWVRREVGAAEVSPIAGATGETYTLTAADAGKVIAVELVPVKDGFAAPAAVTSQATAAVLDVFVAPGTIPVPTGTTHKGQTLTAVTGSWNPTADSYLYQWVRMASADATEFAVIDGATGSKYQLVAADVGTVVAVRIVAVKNGFAPPAAVTSARTGVVLDVFVTPSSVGAPAQQGTPSAILRFGQTLTVPTVGWTPQPANVSYQWVRKVSATAQGSTVIPGATGTTYTLGSDDLGKYIAVRITGTREGFVDSVLTSVGTTKVTAFSFTTRATPTVSGQAIFGRTLTATTGTWAPVPDSYEFEWLRGGTPISGASGRTYTLTVGDIDDIISVRAYGVREGYEDSDGKESATTATVVPATFAGSDPVITGGAYVGQSLTVAPGTVSPEPASITYQWLRAGEVVQANADPYELTDADIGKAVSFRATASSPGYATRVGADSTAAVKARPTFTKIVTPTVSGTVSVGSKLTGARGTWLGTSPVAGYRYQWNANGVAIAGATGASYVLQAAQRAKKITFTVTATLDYGATSASATSRATASVAYGKIAATTPKISGTTRAGKTLTAVPGSWSPSGLTFSYQWLRNGKAISGAKSRTYALTGSDYKKKISVIVKGAKAGYTSVTKTSAQSKSIAVGKLSAATPVITGSVAVGSTVAVRAAWGPGSVSKKYQWYSGSTKISKATKSSYTIPSSLKGKKLTVKVTGKKTGFSSVSKTSSSKTVAKRP